MRYNEKDKNIQAMIDKSVARAYANIAQMLGSFRNRAFSTGSATAPTGVTNAMALIIGAAKLKVRGSGIFLASCSLALTGVTAADTVAMTIGTQTAATGITLGNATQVGPGALTVGQAGTVAGVFVSSMAAGITVASGGGALTQFASGSQVAGTAATTLDFSWTSIIHNSISATVETPFTVGNDIVLTFTINATHSATQVYSGFAMSLEELP